jgi:thiamine kinase-like enzyme
VKPSARQEDNFTATTAHRSLLAACATAGLDSADAVLMRLGENALYKVGDPPAIARIARSEEHLPDVAKELAVARWLEQADFPGVRLRTDIRQPLVVAGRVVSFWKFVESNEKPASMADLAGLLRRLHDLQRPPAPDLPPFDPFYRVECRLNRTLTLPDDDLHFLSSRLTHLRDAYEQLTFELPPGPIHGDAHPGNIICTDDTGPLLLDFERFALGPREWDISIAALYHSTFHWIDDEEYAEFVHSYGFDIMAWPGFPVLQSIRELTMTTWLMQNVDNDPAIRSEFDKRLASLREGSGRRNWRPF